MVFTGPVSPQRFIAATMKVKLVFIGMFGIPLTVAIALVHRPHAVVMFCIPDVELTVML